MQHLGQEHEGMYVEKIEQRHIPLDEARKAKEVFLTSSSVLVMPVVAWDGEPIGDGKSGPNSLAMRVMLENDLVPRIDSEEHHEVPYGYNTGMEYAGSTLEVDPPWSTGA